MKIPTFLQNLGLSENIKIWFYEKGTKNVLELVDNHGNEIINPITPIISPTRNGINLYVGGYICMNKVPTIQFKQGDDTLCIKQMDDAGSFETYTIVGIDVNIEQRQA